jgi:two-component system sensor histidine kinase KdpD
MTSSRGVGVTTTALSGPIDVHMVARERARQGGRPPLASGLTVGHQISGFAVAAAGLPLAPNDTPGGGLIMIFSLPAAAAPPAPPVPAAVAEGLATHPAITSRVDAWRAASRRGAPP